MKSLRVVLYYLFVTTLITSCAHKVPERSSRVIASDPFDICYNLVSKFIGKTSRIFTNSNSNFSKEELISGIDELGTGHILKSLRGTKEKSEVQKKALIVIEDTIETHDQVTHDDLSRALMNNLDRGEQKIFHQEVIVHLQNIRKGNDLTLDSSQGNPLAKLLLSIGSQSERDKLESIIIELKKLNPNMKDNEFNDLLVSSLTACKKR